MSRPSIYGDRKIDPGDAFDDGVLVGELAGARTIRHIICTQIGRYGDPNHDLMTGFNTAIDQVIRAIDREIRGLEGQIE